MRQLALSPRPSGDRMVRLYLIKPSNYDDAGYVVTYFRGVLPSNSLNCLAALTREVVAQKRLGPDIELRVELFDETVQRIPVRRICRSARRSGERAIVCLVGVQTNQFPRAGDLARTFRAAGVTVLIGGFHVSGYLSLVSEIPRDIQSLLDEGVTIVKGEVEETWEQLLADAIAGRLKPLYDFLQCSPDLLRRPIPLVDRKLMKRFAASNHGTIDCGRGCPFNCSFCTIVNVQGHQMRARSAEAIANVIRDNWRQQGVSYYFFTDDNFSRNPHWEAIFDALTGLREDERLDVTFMMQVDTLSYRIPRFVEKARRAGCTQVFIGMESLNPANLKSVGKLQNKTRDYSRLMQAWHEAQIATHVGYILGFPHDTEESVRRDLSILINDLQVEQASFFILTPLPGSLDHLNRVRRGESLDPDLNKYDSMHEAMHFPNFPAPGSLKRLYEEAYETFYQFDNMKRILLRAAPRNYWNIFKNFLWYRHAASLERRHPMMAGFFRRKSRQAMRSGVPVPDRWTFFKTRSRELWAYLSGLARLLREMQELWLQTRPRSTTERAVVQEMHRIYAAVERRLTAAELQMAYRRAGAHSPALKVPSKLLLQWQRWNLFYANRRVFTRRDIDRSWRTMVENLKRCRFWEASPLRLATVLWLDFQVTAMFLLAFLGAGRK